LASAGGLCTDRRVGCPRGGDRFGWWVQARPTIHPGGMASQLPGRGFPMVSQGSGFRTCDGLEYQAIGFRTWDQSEKDFTRAGIAAFPRPVAHERRAGGSCGFDAPACLPNPSCSAGGGSPDLAGLVEAPCRPHATAGTIPIPMAPSAGVKGTSCIRVMNRARTRRGLIAHRPPDFPNSSYLQSIRDDSVSPPRFKKVQSGSRP
jgi:hypothetical protein